MSGGSLNTLTITAIVSLVCSIAISASILVRFAVKYSCGAFNHSSTSFSSFLCSNWLRAFGAFERRAFAFGVLLSLCSILQLVLSITASKSDCTAGGGNTYPILLWLSTVATPVAHLVFVLPSIFECTRAVNETGFSTGLSEASSRRVAVKVLRFLLTFLAFGGFSVALWLPVYVIYMNDASINSTCFWREDSILYYMGKSTSIAACVVLGLLALGIVCGSMAAYIHSAVYKVSSQKAGYRLASYGYLACGLLSIAFMFPETVYRVIYADGDQSVPFSLRLLSMLSNLLHSALLFIVTILSLSLIPSSDLDYGEHPLDTREISAHFSDDDDDDEKSHKYSLSSSSHKQPHFSLTFHAAPRYEDKYLSGIPQFMRFGSRRNSTQHGNRADNHLGDSDEDSALPITAFSTISEMQHGYNYSIDDVDIDYTSTQSSSQERKQKPQHKFTFF
ncbi:hypothetical protein BZA70DRAFT_5174 [Myxozyma melibiosi]|uniref:G-protein coupled receptors family 1 profile domain-containing protein n=1 Tax=Myxozyma melibiosi TaxID=54550 RepID=A0ABR1FDK7_9ASCO